ncbi:MAG: hypothetical protein JWO31_2091, partial [Phycisphaerales bacterium]|nr:hypothetical protein [Phycisphaerales bacterium]
DVGGGYHLETLDRFVVGQMCLPNQEVRTEGGAPLYVWYYQSSPVGTQVDVFGPDGFVGTCSIFRTELQARVAGGGWEWRVVSWQALADSDIPEDYAGPTRVLMYRTDWTAGFPCTAGATATGVVGPGTDGDTGYPWATADPFFGDDGLEARPCCEACCVDPPTAVTLSGHLVFTPSGATAPIDSDFEVTLIQTTGCNFTNATTEATFWKRFTASLFGGLADGECNWFLHPSVGIIVEKSQGMKPGASPFGAYPDYTGGASEGTYTWTDLTIS